MLHHLWLSPSQALTPAWKISLPMLSACLELKFKDAQLVCHEALTGAPPGLSGYTEDQASAGADICQIHHCVAKSKCHFLYI